MSWAGIHMEKTKIVATEWVEESKSILCQLACELEMIGNRKIVTIEPEVFGLDSKNLTPEQEKKLKKLAKMLVGKFINIEAL